MAVQGRTRYAKQALPNRQTELLIVAFALARFSSQRERRGISTDAYWNFQDQAVTLTSWRRGKHARSRLGPPGFPIIIYAFLR